MYIAANMVCYLRKRLKSIVAILVALIAHYKPNLASDGTACNNEGFSTGIYLCPEIYYICRQNPNFFP